MPEFIFNNFQAGPIAAKLSEYLDDKNAAMDQVHASNATMAKLGRGGPAPGLRAARSVLKQIG